MTSPNAADYINLRRDSSWERDLAKTLRGIPEEQRFRFISEMLDGGNSAVALELARRCLKERASFVELLKRGVKTSDASTMRLWIGAVVHPLGLSRVQRILDGLQGDHPRGVEAARYWIRGMFGHSGLLANYPISRKDDQ